MNCEWKVVIVVVEIQCALTPQNIACAIRTFNKESTPEFFLMPLWITCCDKPVSLRDISSEMMLLPFDKKLHSTLSCSPPPPAPKGTNGYRWNIAYSDYKNNNDNNKNDDNNSNNNNDDDDEYEISFELPVGLIAHLDVEHCIGISEAWLQVPFRPEFCHCSSSTT